MSNTTKPDPGWPSKKPGKPSGPGRRVNPPKPAKPRPKSK